jgi:solute carrier family 25 carnitine/acylcarnitine transporter 20/29
MYSQTIHQYINGGISGIAGVLLSHPVDTIKTHIQSGDSMKELQKNITIRRLYRGLSAPLLGVGVEKAIVFGTYNYAYEHTKNIPLSGAIAGFSAAVIVSPYEKIKIQRQQGHSFKYTNPVNLFKGLSATFTREVPGFAIYFSVFEHLKLMTLGATGKTELPHFLAFTYGGISGLSAWIFIYPQDKIKTIIQSCRGNTKYRYQNVLKDLYNDGGLRNIYRGFSWAAYRAVLLHSGTFGMMEILNSVRSNYNYL